MSEAFKFEESMPEETLSINMTPMVDVIFILLVFFLCVSQIKSGRLDIDLPTVDRRSEGRIASSEGQPLVVEVGLKDRLSIAGQPVPRGGSVETLIKAEIERRGGHPLVVLRGDDQASYGTVIRVFSILQGSGIRRIEIDFDPKGSSR